jgi:hypothetical protein
MRTDKMLNLKVPFRNFAKSPNKSKRDMHVTLRLFREVLSAVDKKEALHVPIDSKPTCTLLYCHVWPV